MKSFHAPTAVALVAVALGLAACGSGSSEDSSTTAAAPATTGTSTTTVASAEGEKVFASNCAQCHTLAAAGSNGQVGPNLDGIAPDDARVKAIVTNGRGGMPAFADVLTDAQIDAVASYVADSTGN
ncbi:MAG: cytochrome c [Solirubrobacteraceae bacterium]|jgi:mono/diheme cytochrome c family protein|nr:cytochrome c [Solirubrobacteraceae bacterium]MDP4673105.1 cytochrome c [Solirubrobacteraceae bacterium]